MSSAKLSTQEVCQALMREVCEAIYGSARRQVDFLRYGARDRLEADIGKHILTLASLPFTEQQLTALEAAIRQAQEETIGWLFSLLDGSSQPPGWPDALRLVNMDTGEAICPEAFKWEFGLALADYRARLDQETRASPDETPHTLDHAG